MPTLRVERRLLRGCLPPDLVDGASRPLLLAGMDEVGRGALGGPVSVGVAVVDLDVRSAPKGLRDSKLLTPQARGRLAPRVRRWARASAVGHASAAEIDAIGILRALRLAGLRALAALPVIPDLVLLDGNHNWLVRRPEQPGLFDAEPSGPAPDDLLHVPVPPVTTMVKADLRCAAVAAASVLAKTERDALMVELAGTHTGYAWDENKGYASPHHLEALRASGPCVEHRRSWNLKVLAERGGELDIDALVAEMLDLPARGVSARDDDGRQTA